jgi:inosine/xanthosine triphosphatase
VSAEVLESPLAELRSVRVGSTNEPKLEAVRRALAPFAPRVAVAGHPVESGVPEQPVGWEEIVAGARNRARAAASQPCDLGVGIEDGLVPVPGADGGERFVNVGCAALVHGERIALGFSSGFAYPPACAGPAAREREPIGPLFDAYWRERRGDGDVAPSGRGIGNVGKLTLGVLPRCEYARHAVLCALVELLHPDLYELAAVA